MLCFLSARGGPVGLPALDELVKKLKKAGVEKALFRGELYLPMIKGERRPTVAEVVSASFARDKEDVEKLRMALFDLVMLDGGDLRDDGQSFQEEWEQMKELVGTNQKDLVHRAEGAVVKGKEVEMVFDQKVKAGEEGIVIRLLDKADLYKLKPKQTVDCVVMGYVEGEVEGGIGVTSVFGGLNYSAAKGKDLVLQSFARVGSGLEDELRVDLLRRLKPLKVDNPIPMTDSDGRPVWFVKPELIFEMSGEDLIPADFGKSHAEASPFAGIGRRQLIPTPDWLLVRVWFFPRFRRCGRTKQWIQGEPESSK